VVSPFAPPNDPVHEGVTLDKPSKTYDGFTLLSTNRGSQAALLDMRGKVVHEWHLPFSQAWPHLSHIQAPLRDEQIHWFRCHLFPNGGMKQRLPNGNTLIVDPDMGRLLEVTLDKELVWENYGFRPITGARRYAADELTFLQGVALPRP
jgi:hypothetical protein